MVLAFLILLGFELSPIGWGDMSQLIGSLKNRDPDNPWYLLQRKPEKALSLENNLLVKNHWIVATYSVAWSVFFLIFVLKLTITTWPYLWYSVETRGVTEAASSGYILANLIISCIYMTFLTTLSLYKRYKETAVSFFDLSLSRLSREEIPVINKSETHELLLRLPVLNWFDEDQLKSLLSHSKFISLRKGQMIYDQGDSADDLFVLLSGEVVLKSTIDADSDKYKRWSLHPACVFGEEGLLDGREERRDSRAVASGHSTIVQIPTSEIFQLIEEAHFTIQLDSFRTAIMLNQYFHSAPIFSELSEDSIHFMMAKGIIVEKKANEVVFQQGSPSDDFFLLVRGSVRVLINNECVNVIPQGGFFGEIGVIADIPRTATIETSTDCILFQIGADDFWEVLTHKLEMAIFIETVGEIRLKEDLEYFNGKDEEKAAS